MTTEGTMAGASTATASTSTARTATMPTVTEGVSAMAGPGVYPAGGMPRKT